MSGILYFFILVVVHGSMVSGDTRPFIGGFECVQITECPMLYELLAKKPVPNEWLQHIKQSHCGFDKLIEKVWCPKFIVTEDSGEEATEFPTIPPTPPQEPLNNSVFAIPLSNPVLKTTYPKELPPLSECGRQSYDKVHGGESTELDEYPWLAVLKYETNSGLKHGCGGSLISKRYVLTAAHCVTKQVPPSVVVLGEYSLMNETDCLPSPFGGKPDCSDPPITVGIEDIIVHSEWTKQVGRPFFDDIALIRLKEDVKFSDFVRPICLPVSLIKPSQNYTSAGWGLTEKNVKSDIKLKVSLPRITTPECAFTYKRYLSKTGQLCAGGEKGKDTCKGDSGGPLMNVDLGTGAWSVAGIVSMGPKDCGTEGVPGIYTNVPNYMDWIFKEIRP